MKNFYVAIRFRTKNFILFIKRHFQILREVKSNEEFIRSSYFEVYLILRYLFPFLFVVYIPFAALDWTDFLKNSGYFPLLIYNSIFIPGCFLFTALLNLPILKSENGRRWLTIAGTLFLTSAGTAMNLLIFQFGTDISLFAFTQLGIAVLLRYPDKTKKVIYFTNYAIFFAAMFWLGKNSSFLIQNFFFTMVMTILLDLISLLTKVNSFHKEQSIRELNRKLVMESIKKSEILRIAIHDLKSPVTGILSLVGLYTREPSYIPVNRVASSYADPPEILDHIDRTSRKILESIEDVLYLASSGDTETIENQTQKLNPELLLKSVTCNLNFLFSSKNIEVKDELSEYNFYFQANPQILYRVFDNLLSNAAKFSPENSEIYLKSELISEVYEKILIIKIEDSGPGFQPEDEKNMFREFSILSAKPTGSESSSGIGLALAKKLLDRMGIRIRLGNSKALGGAQVILEFPQSKAK
ncbi:sensor histidine kinase [Leptospira hartskeerlii]|uniref:histidine kinase n=1 Tax=Leptospira hartskeerlii TaxID=2023177 RepID=A0A2M9XDK1_9LEPT|nr:HAMP domain-containing sensor histidine kinase [Leptospira hartskeerlii]PJZ25773.1 sensor histidine kinase [Leptospira hartskeerlii]PJZ35404.1 sensor histidine kinase [Leptospira hartskeerlii]